MKTILAAIIAYSLGAGAPPVRPMASAARVFDKSAAGNFDSANPADVPNLGFGWVTARPGAYQSPQGPVYDILTPPIRVPQTVIPVGAAATGVYVRDPATGGWKLAP